MPATSFMPVTGSGGAAPLSYSVTPVLPTGLSLNPTTGAITGTPTATLAATTFTVTVTDSNSATASNTFSLVVAATVTATQSVASTTLTQNHAATSFAPVTGAGGTAPLSYSVSPGPSIRSCPEWSDRCDLRHADGNAFDLHLHGHGYRCQQCDRDRNLRTDCKFIGYGHAGHHLHYFDGGPPGNTLYSCDGCRWDGAAQLQCFACVACRADLWHLEWFCRRNSRDAELCGYLHGHRNRC